MSNMAKPKRFDSLSFKGVRLTPEQIDKAERIGNGDFSNGIRRAVEFFNEEYTDDYVRKEKERLAALMHCNELQRQKIEDDLKRFDAHKDIVVNVKKNNNDAKNKFLKKCVRQFQENKLRFPDKYGFMFRGYIEGPAMEQEVISIFGSTKAAYPIIAKAVGDRSWLPGIEED